MPIGLSLASGTRKCCGEDDRLYPVKVLEKADSDLYMLIIYGTAILLFQLEEVLPLRKL